MGRLLHGSQSIRLFTPLPPAGRLSVVSHISDMQDKGPGKNAIVAFTSVGIDPDTDRVLAESTTTSVIRGAGGFGGQPGQRRTTTPIPDREPDARIALPRRDDQALVWRLSGDRNALHS